MRPKFHLPPIVLDDPAPVPKHVLVHDARRARVSLAHVAIVAQLAGLGSQETQR